MNKENCSHADRCKFGENCEREYNPLAEYLCFDSRKRGYNQYEAMLAKCKHKTAKEGAANVRVRQFD